MQFVDGLQTDHSRLFAGAVENAVVVGHAGRVRHGRQGAFLCASYFVNQDRFTRFSGSLHQLATICDAFQIQPDHLRFIRLKIIDQIRFIHIAFVADTDNLVHADEIVKKGLNHQHDNAAALDDKGNVTRCFEYPAHFDQAGIDAIETAEFLAGIQCSQTVGPHDPNAVGFGDFVDFALHGLAVTAAFGKSGAFDDDPLDSFTGAIADDPGDVFGRHDNDGQIRTFGKIEYR